MRGLTIIVADVSSERFRGALNLACAAVALGGRVRLFLDGEAVSIPRAPMQGWEDDAYAEVGLPTLPEQFSQALDMGVEVILCQAGMQMTGAEMADYDSRVQAGGMVSLLAALGDDRLVLV